MLNHLKLVYNTEEISVVCLIMYCFFPAAPGRVGNLIASFSTMSNYDSSTQLLTADITITWTEPMYPNGVIQTYRVTVTNTDDSSLVYNNSTLTDTTVTASVMVLPFTDYTVTVAASTSAGEGEGETFTLTAPQAGMYVYRISHS